MSIADRFLYRLVGVAGALFIRLLGRTIRIVEPNRNILDDFSGRGRKVIFALCHGQLILGTYFARNERVASIISQHRDGEYIYQITRRMGIEAVRGSSTRGGASAILKLLKAPQFASRNLGVITDGPTGPREIVKPGIIMLSRLTGYPIVPIAIASSSGWELASWDRFTIPRPFSSALLLLGDPMTVDRGVGAEEQEALRQRLQENMRRLNRTAGERVGLDSMNSTWLGPPEFTRRWLRALALVYIGRYRETWWSFPVTIVLFPVERLHRLFLVLRNYLYEVNLFRVRRLPVPVVSVGNISVGGTGKTMLVMCLSEFLTRRGYRVAVLTRGYGGSTRDLAGDARVVKGYDSGNLQAGDEPVLLSRKLPECIVIRGRNRYLSGLIAVGHYGCDICVLDDGFQHRGLHRDVDIVLLHRENPLGTGLLLPAGFLREGISGLSRADLIVECTRWGNDKGTLAGSKFPVPPGCPRASASLMVDAIYPLGSNGENSVASDLQGKKVLAFAGIGDPTSFRKVVERLSPMYAEYHIFQDHFRYAGKSADELNRRFDMMEADVMITTEKDAVKLRPSLFDPRPCWVISARLNIDRGWEEMEDLVAMCDTISGKQPHSFALEGEKRN